MYGADSILVHQVDELGTREDEDALHDDDGARLQLGPARQAQVSTEVILGHLNGRWP